MVFTPPLKPGRKNSPSQRELPLPHSVNRSLNECMWRLRNFLTEEVSFIRIEIKKVIANLVPGRRNNLFFHGWNPSEEIISALRSPR